MDIPLAMTFSPTKHHSRAICRWPRLTMVTDHHNHTRTSRTQYYQASRKGFMTNGLGLLATTGCFGCWERNTIKLLVRASWLASGLGLLATTGCFGCWERNIINLLIRASWLVSGLWLPSNHWVFWVVLGCFGVCYFMCGTDGWLWTVTWPSYQTVARQSAKGYLHNKVANSD